MNIACLPYCLEQERFFRLLIAALPSGDQGRIIGVRKRDWSRIASALLPTSHLTPLSDDVAERILALDARLELLNFPRRDPARVRERLLKRATQWYHYFRRELAGVDLLIAWNGFPVPPAAGLAAARSLGIPTIYAELGVLPGTIAFDPRGINFQNSLTGRPADFYRAVTLDERKVHDLFNATLPQRAPKKMPANTTPDQPLPPRFLFFPMQVHDDTQLQLFSPRFRSMEETARYLRQEVIAHNRRTGDTLELVIKEHPSDAGRADYARLRETMPDVTFLRWTPIRDIVPKAQAVATINSSVGIETLFSLRPVITLGSAFYNVPGLVRHLGEDALADVLPEVIGQPVDEDLITRFLYFLRYHYLVTMPYWTADEATIRPAVERILDLYHHRLPWLEELVSSCRAGI